MTNLAHTIASQSPSVAADTVSIMEGAGTQLFTSGSAPTSSDMMAGDAVEMFTTSCIETSSDASTGDAVALFTTSC